MPALGTMWRGLIEFGALSCAFFVVLRLAQLVRALRIAVSIGIMYAGSIAARYLDLPICARILQAGTVVAVVLLIIVFQPEIRRALANLDGSWFTLRRRTTAAPATCGEIASAVFTMASNGTGALIVLVRREPVVDLVDGGVPLHAHVSSQLLRSLFRKGSPLHDGAVVIDRNRLVCANAILPLTEQLDTPRHFGTRHRAAMGITERTDSIAIVVSEERSEISAFVRREQAIVRTQEELVGLLSEGSSSKRRSLTRAAISSFTDNWQLKLASLAGAALILGGVAILSGSTVRIFSVPVEFDNVPRGVDVVAESTADVQVQVRGRSWLMDETSFSRLAVHLNLHNSALGTQTIAIDTRALSLPPGLRALRLTPRQITVHLEQEKRR
jgi:uncharacterized protein (TIGR00159 family)